MRRKSETTGFVGRSIGNEGLPVTPESTRAYENEEWAWMVAEDPAFYLAKPGRTENTGG